MFRLKEFFDLGGLGPERKATMQQEAAKNDQSDRNYPAFPEAH
jgi:hypothetical protein